MEWMDGLVPRISSVMYFDVILNHVPRSITNFPTFPKLQEKLLEIFH